MGHHSPIGGAQGTVRLKSVMEAIERQSNDVVVSSIRDTLPKTKPFITHLDTTEDGHENDKNDRNSGM
jgi:hypothetical protein